MKKGFTSGGSSRIGLDHYYAKMGCDIILMARDQEKLDAAVSACNSVAVDSGQITRGESLDITDYHSLPVAMDKMVSRDGAPDLLILCAGVAGDQQFHGR